MLSVPILDNPAWSTVHQLNFADPCEDFVAPVAHALVRAASTLVSTLGVISSLVAAPLLCGAANPGCRRLSAGAWSFYIFAKICFDSIAPAGEPQSTK
jgi:hypothetical protein